MIWVKAFVTYPLSICCFECENKAQLWLPKVGLSMLQIEKPVILHERAVKAGSHIIAAIISIAAVNSKTGLTIGTII